LAEDLLRELTSIGQDTPSSTLAFIANDDPEKQELAKKVMRDVAGAMGGVNKWRSCAREDLRYYYGHQWPDIDKMRMEQLRRPALTFNEIGNKIDAISGIERLNRSEVRFVSRALDSDVAHDAAGDLATEAVATVEDMCDGEMEDSRAIKDALITGLGVVEIAMDYQTDEDGEVEKHQFDNMEYIWDQKCRQDNLVDRQWQARIKDYSRKDFRKRWPGKIDIIDQAAVYYQEDAISKYELVTPYYSLQNEKANPSLDLQATASVANIPVTQYQWIDQVPVYRIADPQNPDQLTSLDEEQWAAVKKKAALGGNPPPKAVRQLRGVYKQVYVAVGVVLEDPIVLPGDFTIKPITGQWDSDKKVWYGVVRGLKDPQSTMNKSVSALVTEYITNAKGGVIFKTGTFADSAMAKNQWAQPDAWVEANRDADLDRDIKPRQAQQVSQFPTMLFQESKDSMTRISGVSDEMIGTATGEQTGPTIDRRLQGGLAILGWLWDNVARFKKDIAHTELEFIREFWSHGQLIVVGGNFNSQSIPLLKSDLPIVYNMVLDQSVRYNPNLKDQIWQDLMNIAGPLLKVPAGQQILLKGLKFSHFPVQLVQEIQQAVAEQPPQPPKGGGRQPPQGKQEDPNFTQAKIRKMDAETQRTMAETRKLDADSKLGIASLAVDAIQKGAQHRQSLASHQHQVQMDRAGHQHQVLMDRVNSARQAQQQMFNQAQPVQGPPTGAAGPNQ
jgi:hypothetical protein